MEGIEREAEIRALEAEIQGVLGEEPGRSVSVLRSLADD
jgi:hypothetical protein